MSSQALSRPDNVAQQAVDRWRIIKAAQLASAASAMRRQMSEVRSLLQTLWWRGDAKRRTWAKDEHERMNGRAEGRKWGREAGRQGHNMQLYAININHLNCHKKRNVHFECGRARTNSTKKRNERECERTRAKIGSSRKRRHARLICNWNA